MSTRVKRLFHWSLPSRAAGIARDGLLPCCATGAMRVVWLCDRASIRHYREHVAKHWGVPPECLQLWSVKANPAKLRRIRPGVYVTAQPIRVSDLRRAMGSLNQTVRDGKKGVRA